MPFGLTFNSYTSPSVINENLYKYNGKEEQGEIGWIDYGARMYQADLGRWHVIDPMYDRHYDWSPYAYVLNNPIANLDLYGLTDWSTVLEGVATFTGGLLATAGGIAAAGTPTGVGQVGGAFLISTGVPAMGFGVAQVIDGIQNDGAFDIPGGVTEAVGLAADKGLGNENNELRITGSITDMVSGGAPKALVTGAIAVVGVTDLVGDITDAVTGDSQANSNSSETSAEAMQAPVKSDNTTVNNNNAIVETGTVENVPLPDNLFDN